jgi:hypothetical protein
MYDCGLSYIYYLLRPFLASNIDKSISPIFLDISNVSSSESVLKELVFSIQAVFSEIKDGASYASLVDSLSKAVKDSKIAFIVYAGEDGHIDADLLIFLQRLRNLLGWRFSFCILVSARYLLKSTDAEIVGNIIKQTTIPILLCSREDSTIVIKNYEERMQKNISQEKKDAIATLSGGNPGLIKALFLQAITSPTLKDPDLLDEMLFFRLKEITSDLPAEYLRVMLSESIGKEDELIRLTLLRYGYLIENNGVYSAFSPLFVEYLKKFVLNASGSISKYSLDINKTDIYLTKSQRTVYLHFKIHPGEIVSRDILAKLLWGDNWTEKYSDWAIDQQLSELRKQLRKIKIRDTIVTKKGEGFVFLPQV